MDNEIIRMEAVTPSPAVPVRRPRTRLMVAILGAAVVIAASIGVSAAMAADPTGTAAGAGAGGPIAPDAVFTKFAACMKDHGIDIGTPITVSSDSTATGVSGVVSGGAIEITPSDATLATGSAAIPAPFDAAAFKAANDACTPILDAAGITSGTGTIVSGSGTASSGTLASGSLQVGTGSGAGVIGVATAGGDVTTMAADLRTYAACMRSKGIDQPDPVVDAAAGTVQLQMTGDPTSAAFQSASKACGASLPLVPLQVPAQP
jgi:hypothetical protein